MKRAQDATFKKQQQIKENGHPDADADDSRPWDDCVNEKFGSMERHLVSVVLHPKFQKQFANKMHTNLMVWTNIARKMHVVVALLFAPSADCIVVLLGRPFQSSRKQCQRLRSVSSGCKRDFRALPSSKEGCAVWGGGFFALVA